MNILKRIFKNRKAEQLEKLSGHVQELQQTNNKMIEIEKECEEHFDKIKEGLIAKRAKITQFENRRKFTRSVIWKELNDMYKNNRPIKVITYYCPHSEWSCYLIDNLLWEIYGYILLNYNKHIDFNIVECLVDYVPLKHRLIHCGQYVDEGKKVYKVDTYLYMWDKQETEKDELPEFIGYL